MYMKNIGWICLIALLAACGSEENPEAENQDEPVTLQEAPKQLNPDHFDLQGHRGCRGLMPENTIPAMIKALELGVTTLEMDVVFTADGVAILSHEPFFNHEITTRPNGEMITEETERSFNIYRMRFEETKRYDVGLKAHPRFPEQQKMAVTKPSLEEVISAVKNWCATAGKPLPYFNIETKTTASSDNEFHPEPEKFVDSLMAIIDKNALNEKVIIQSFDFRTLQHLHEHYPAVATAALIEDFDFLPMDKQLEKLGFKPNFYSPAWQLVTDTMVNKLHKDTIRIIPWTVNDSATAARMHALGVDGMITDYPDRIH